RPVPAPPATTPEKPRHPAAELRVGPRRCPVRGTPVRGRARACPKAGTVRPRRGPARGLLRGAPARLVAEPPPTTPATNRAGRRGRVPARRATRRDRPGRRGPGTRGERPRRSPQDPRRCEPDGAAHWQRTPAPRAFRGARG